LDEHGGEIMEETTQEPLAKRTSKTVEERRQDKRERQRAKRAEARASREQAAAEDAGNRRPAYEGPDPPTDEPIWAMMRRVFALGERDDKRHGERRLREMLNRDPKGFFLQMIAFEKDDVERRAADVRGKAAVEKPEPEPNAERLRELCRSMLADFAKQEEELRDSKARGNGT
jgi:hypothetical protein